MKNKFFNPITFTVLLSILWLITGCINENSEHHEIDNDSEHATVSKDQKKLRHVVLFKFKEGTSQESIAEVEASFKSLPNKIKEIKDFEWGTNNSPEGLDKGFTHCFFLTFDSEEGRAVYLPHPDHKAFGAVLGPHLEDVLVLDYWTKE